MPSTPKTVFVLGAGFTKAFAPTAPLLVDDYYDDLKQVFNRTDQARSLLKQERQDDGRIDLERLMTRLATGMPYDWRTGLDIELRPLLAGTIRCLRNRLNSTTLQHKSELDALAIHCKRNAVHCITFNYDTFLDQALWETRKDWRIPDKWWDPDWGYGFACQPSVVAVGAFSGLHRMTMPSIFLLKLHGSLNWRVKHGESRPYGVGAVAHHESWCHLNEANPNGEDLQREAIEAYLDCEPVIVPPVLTKSDLVEHPLLRVIWSLAYESLTEATQVTFVGYSLPRTDIAAGTLFREALAHLKPTDIKVVDRAPGDEQGRKQKERELLAAYGNVFPGITEAQLDLRGGLEWSRELVTG